MSGISSGIGLISGIPSASLIDQLIAIDRRPITILQSRVSEIDTQRSAFLELSAQILSAQNSVTLFGKPSFFNRFTSTSTNDKVLTATAGEKALPGSFTLRVRSLVTNHSLLSRRFTDADSTPVGSGTLTVEVGHGRVNQSTKLDSLNAGAGVRRGIITITDRSGGSADIDLSTAMTIRDVLDAINSNPNVNVRASATSMASSSGATGDRLVIEDLSNQALLNGTERFTIADKGNGSFAADLGIAADVTGGRIDGTDLVRLSNSTRLSTLNDGNGVDRLLAGTDLKFSTTNGDFTVSLSNLLSAQLDTDLRSLNSGRGVRLGTIRITDRSGQSAQVDLSSATTVRDIVNAINAANVSVTATVIDSHFSISDTTNVDEANAQALKIEDVTGFTAADLGLVQEVNADKIDGREVYRVDTVGDVLNAINFAQGNGSLVQATLSADGKGISLTALGGGNTVTVTAGDGSSAAEDLGLLNATFSNATPFTSRRLIAGLDTVLLHSLRGGQGVTGGIVSLTDRAGNSSTLDFSGDQTLQDVIDRINADTTVQFTAAINAAGNGLTLRDESNGSNPEPIITDVTGTLATDLGIAVGGDPLKPFTGTVINGGNAQLQYISRQTPLADLGAGRGVSSGSFQVIDSNGTVLSINLDDKLKTVGEVIDRINLVKPDTLLARINDTGDGILLVDSAGGSLPLTVEDRNGGRAAADLRLAGTARSGQNVIDGSFEIRVDIGADDTLRDVARKLNDAGIGLSASILSQGGAGGPANLTITSGVSGLRGELTVDSLGLDLGLTTLSRAQDALVTIGNDSTANPLLIAGSSNSLDNVIEGVTLNLLSANDTPVTVTISQDVNGIVDSINTFVSNFNQVLDTLDKDTSFDQDTLKSGPLLGDATVSLIRSRLSRIALQRFGDPNGGVSSLLDIGIRSGTGGRLSFDEQRFRDVAQSSPKLLQDFFTQKDTGLGDVLKNTFEDLTRNFDGVISRKDNLLNDKQKILNDRVDRLNSLLDAKRSRLEAQFAALESTIAALQQQQNSLATLTQLVGA